MMEHKVKAFTILEVTITMLIAGLLIGITYASYSIIIKSYHSFTIKNDDMTIIVSLDHLLKRDFDQADTIFKEPDGISVKKDVKIVKYTFRTDFIVRESARIDTFKVQAIDVTAMFENTAVNEIQATAEQNRIDQLDFVLIFQTEKIPYHYRKLYSSENLVQRNPDAVN